MPIDIIYDLKMAKLEPTMDTNCVAVERESCHVIRGDLDCRSIRSSVPSGCDGAATQNQAKRFVNVAREVVRPGRQ